MGGSVRPPVEPKLPIWRQAWNAFIGMGDLPISVLLFVPRLAISYFIVGLAMICRAVARISGAASPYDPKANLRILIITDYMPPQTHGIAIRFRQYIDYMRREGHEVHVFCTNTVKERETSFDHPNLPAITNPYNSRNKMAYSAGVKLAWYLSAKQWDLVHVVCPSNICWAVLPVCVWRRIPSYCSHHVDLDYYIYEYIKMKAAANFGYFVYSTVIKEPCKRLATINAAPTHVFLDSHIPKETTPPDQLRRRIPSGVADERFKVDSVEQLARERATLVAKAGLPPGSNAAIMLMVQRLAPEKGTVHALTAIANAPREAGKPITLDGKRPLHLMIAGDGPSKKSLERYAAEQNLPITFLGNVPNDQLPPLYRAADLFVTCSTSETYGLTVLEALACGTPAVLPHCAVFDELWIGKVPSEWMYDETVDGDLLRAMAVGLGAPAKARLVKSPIQASWADATRELLEHYKDAITANLEHRNNRESILRGLVSLGRALSVTLLSYWVVRSYTKRAFKIGLWFVDDLLDHV